MNILKTKENGYRSMWLPYRLRALYIIPVLIIVFFIGMDRSEARTLYSAHVYKIIDGDSILAVYEGKKLEVRLWGIDAPEYRQAYSRSAAKFLRKLLQGKTVNLLIKDVDKYGRLVAMRGGTQN